MVNKKEPWPAPLSGYLCNHLCSGNMNIRLNPDDLVIVIRRELALKIVRLVALGLAAAAGKLLV